jgi:UTP--glucose-1-phosphate uridylyltransferase
VRPGYISHYQAQPVDTLPTYTELDPCLPTAGEKALSRTVVIKLNGGLGTSMGMDGPKSLLPVKRGCLFSTLLPCQIPPSAPTEWNPYPPCVDEQFLRQRRKSPGRALQSTSGSLPQGHPLEFLQHKQPKNLEN